MRPVSALLSVLVVTFITTGAISVSAQSQIAIPRIQGEIILDGMSDEPAWEGVTAFTYVIHKPVFGEEPSERSEVLIGHDDDYIYIAGRLFDREPEDIASFSKKRDSNNPNCQWFGIALDTFNDKESGVAFFTTPSGLRWDATITNDNVGNIRVEPSWNTFWDVEVSRNGEGWFAEFRIPISSLRFQDTDGTVVMGLISWRSIPRRNETDIFPAVPPNWGDRSFYKMSEAQEIVFEQLHSRKPLYIAPYFTGGLDRNNVLDESATAYHRDDTSQMETGLDVKYGLTSNLTLDVTINTDFAQVEADDEQINLTRYSLFFPEKRLFFQERASIFNFDLEATDKNRLFYSRRIGMHEGKPVRIYGGARVVGRIGSWDIGFLNMQTEKIETAPSENFGVLRLRRQILNPYSSIGAITTSRTGTDGSYNLAYGLDGVFRLHGEDYLSIKWAQTFSDSTDTGMFSVDPSRVFVILNRRSIRGFVYNFAYSYAGREYQPGMGFELRDNYSRYAVYLQYGFFPEGASRLFSHRPGITGIIYRRNADGSIESANFGPSWHLETRSGYWGNAKVTFHREDITDTFPISGNVEIPAGAHDFADGSVSFGTPEKQISASTTFTGGSFYDGKRMAFEISPVWNISSSVELSGMYQVSHLAFASRNSDFTGHVGRLRMLYMLNADFSVSTFVQYNSATDVINVNSRIRYNPREGIDFYLVFNELDNTDRYDYRPVLPVTRNRTVLLKYTYTFNR